MSVQPPVFTNADLILRDAALACCSANLAYTLVVNESQGIEVCDCSYQELYYLTQTKKTFESTIDILQNPGVDATASINIVNNAFSISAIVLTINGVAVYSHASFATYIDMLSAVAAASYSSGIDVTWNGGYVLSFTSPAANHYNGVSIHFQYFDNGVAKALLQFSTQFAGGEAIQSFPPTCLTDARIEQIFENTAEICGCSECAITSDAPTPVNAIVINRVSIYPLVIHFTAADFVGLNYTPTGAYSLVGKHAGGGTPQFDVYSDAGSGVLLTYGTEYTFNSGSGTLIFPNADNYMLIIYS